MFSVSEHGRIFLSDVNETLSDGNLRLRERYFRALLTLLESQDDELPDYTPIFTYLRPRGVEQLKVQNFVGVIRLSEAVQIEVLPKISKRLNTSAARDLLVRMLIEVESSPFFEGFPADLRAHEMPLFELILRRFLDLVAALVRKGIARAYVSRQDNLVFIRGKLQIGEQLRRNSHNNARVHCEFDEYEANRPVNRLIKGALLIVARLSSDSENQQLCRELLHWFDGVPATGSHTLDFKRMRKDRLVQHYAPAMPLCRLILESLNPLTQQGENEVVSMLFPMERVFEDYVAARLPRQFADWEVSKQVTGRALVENHAGRRVFNLRPDLVFSRSEVTVVADTKWKLLNESERGKGYGISQSDIYQLFGYLKKYLHNHTAREVLAIFPASDTFRSPLEPFWFRSSDEVLHVVPYDLERDRLHLPAASLLQADSRVTETIRQLR